MVKSWWRRVDGSLKITGFIVGPEKSSKSYYVVLCQQATHQVMALSFMTSSNKNHKKENEWNHVCKKNMVTQFDYKKHENKSKIRYWYGVSLPSFLPSL